MNPYEENNYKKIEYMKKNYFNLAFFCDQKKVETEIDDRIECYFCGKNIEKIKTQWTKDFPIRCPNCGICLGC